MRRLVILTACILLTVLVSHVNAQPPFTCGGVYNFSVTFNMVDSAGFAPRAKAGDEAIVGCIAKRDPYFLDHRFASAIDAANYWYVLFGQELGVTFEPIRH